jgi:uncharacterized protein (TIGR02246 family)
MNIPRYFVMILVVLICSIIYIGILPGWIRESEMIMQDESDVIIAVMEAFAESWNKGDAKTAASFFTEDGLRVGAFGDMQKGRTEIEAAYDRLLHQTMPGAIVEQEPGTVRMLTPDLAIWQARIVIIPPGDASPMKGHVVQIMKKVDDRWLIFESHPKFFPHSADTR